MSFTNINLAATHAIKCYQCTSPDCDDPFETAGSEYLEDCDKESKWDKFGIMDKVKDSLNVEDVTHCTKTVIDTGKTRRRI